VTRIPLVDLVAQHRTVADEVERGFARVLGRASFILGEEVEAFEEAWKGTWKMDPQMEELRIASVSPGVIIEL